MKYLYAIFSPNYKVTNKFESKCLPGQGFGPRTAFGTATTRPTDFGSLLERKCKCPSGLLAVRPYPWHFFLAICTDACAAEGSEDSRTALWFLCVAVKARRHRRNQFRRENGHFSTQIKETLSLGDGMAIQHEEVANTRFTSGAKFGETGGTPREKNLSKLDRSITLV